MARVGLTGQEVNVTMFNKVAVPAGTQSVAANELATMNDVDQAVKNACVSVMNIPAVTIKILKATPRVLVPKAGAGLAIVVHRIIFNYTRTTASFTNGGGGDVTVGFGDVPILTAAEVTALITAGASAITIKNPLDGYVLPTNTDLTISKATAEFVGATAAGSMKITVLYSVVTP